MQAIIYAYTHTIIQLGSQLQAVVDEFQERSLLGLMREFTLTFMQWWGDACAQSQPILPSAIMAFFSCISARPPHQHHFGLVYYTTRITFVANVALLFY